MGCSRSGPKSTEIVYQRPPTRPDKGRRAVNGSPNPSSGVEMRLKATVGPCRARELGKERAKGGCSGELGHERRRIHDLAREK
jgi:hypothetical protein